MAEQLKFFMNRTPRRQAPEDLVAPLRNPPTDLFPKRLVGALVERVMFEEYPTIGLPNRTQSIYVYSALPHGIELLATDQPYPREIVKSFAASKKKMAFHQRMGYLRYDASPFHLMHFYNEAVKFLGVPGHIENRYRSYQPDGPWEFIPPQHAFDFRVRARCVIPVNTADVSLTKLAAHTTHFTSRGRYTIDYTPGSPATE